MTCQDCVPAKTLRTERATPNVWKRYRFGADVQVFQQCGGVADIDRACATAATDAAAAATAVAPFDHAGASLQYCPHVNSLQRK